MRQFFVNRRWQIGLLFVLVVSGSLMLASYDFSLPYIDHPDEPNYYLAALEWRGLFGNPDVITIYKGTHPGYIALQTVLQPLLETAGLRDLAANTRIMRLLSLTATLFTLTLIAQTARRMAGDVAGWVAGAAWGIAPLVVKNGVHALPDPYVYFFVALSLWLAVEALIVPERRGWCVGSVVAGLLAFLMKYPALPALLPGGLVALWILRQDRRRGLRLLVIQVVLGAAVGLWVLFGYGIDFSNLRAEGAIVQNQGVSNLLNPARVFNNIRYAVFPLQTAVWLALVAVGVVAYFVAKKRLHVGAVGLCLVIVITIPWLASSFYQVEPDKIRYVLAATAAACVVLGVAVQQIVWTMPRRLAVPLTVAGLAWVIVPQVSPTLELVAERRLPDTRVELRRWFDINLDPGTVIVDADNHKTFNPIWGGIPHRTWVDWQEASVTDYSLTEWRERGLSYAVVPRWQVGELEENAEGQAYLDAMLHLRNIYIPPAAHGPQMAFYRLWRMDVERVAEFDDGIRLIGYDQSSEKVEAGVPLTFRFYWRAVTTPTDNYSLFMHLVPLDNDEIMAQVDGSPAVLERPTLTWDDASETLISPAYTLSMPDTPGSYRVFIGLYNYTSGQRLKVNFDEDALLLRQISIPSN